MRTVVLVIDVQRALVEPPHDVVDADGLVTLSWTGDPCADHRTDRVRSHLPAPRLSSG